MTPPPSASPQEVLNHLGELFPGFADGWKRDEDPAEDAIYGELTHHRVMSEFLIYFSAHHASCGSGQLERLGAWLSDAVSTDGPLENSVSTGFLEHMRQTHINRVLAPHLSRQARDKAHA